MKRLGRLIVSLIITAVIGGVCGTNIEGTGVLGALLVGFAFCCCYDFLEILGATRVTNFIRIGSCYFLIFAGIMCALTATWDNLIGQYVNFYNLTKLEQIITCGCFPATIATLWFATLSEYYDDGERRGLFPILPLGGLLVGAGVGFLIQLLSPLGLVVLFIAVIAVSIIGIVPLVKFYLKNGLIMFSNHGGMPADMDNDYDSSSSYSTSSSSSGSSSSYSGSSYNNGSSEAEYEGNSQLDYYMDDIASDNSRSRNLPYNCSISSDVSFSHYGDDAYFTVDFTIDTSCCSAETQSEYNVMIGDAQRFQREVMNDLFREGKSLINRLKQKHKGWRGVNFEVKLGNISEY